MTHVCTRAHALNYGRVHIMQLLKATQLINRPIGVHAGVQVNTRGKSTFLSSQAHALGTSKLSNRLAPLVIVPF